MKHPLLFRRVEPWPFAVMAVVSLITSIFYPQFRILHICAVPMSLLLAYAGIGWMRTRGKTEKTISRQKLP